MGCGSSTFKPPREPVKIPLSVAQKYLVRETWETIEQHSKAVGKKTFLRFFEINPDYQKLFPEFATLDQVELEQANALHGHAKRVMKAVENAVSAMDDAESFAAYLENLGARHKARALKPAYLDAMQVAYTDTIQDLLKTQWTDGTAEAWNKLFRFIADTMKHGLSS
ncbi:globin [Nematostella vectensis]|uniref:globin n=1 Tax=Nematostella vectensis TaxID=45351 RepID=UPI0020777CF7|nr:globin [Nematostella vectensis]XP_048577309.1 globin [Nematostella vectensis]